MTVTSLISASFYADIHVMATLIENQTVSRRSRSQRSPARKTSNSRHKSNSADRTSDFIGLFSQKPRSQKKRKVSKPEKSSRREQTRILPRTRKTKTEKSGSGFTIKVPLASLFLIAGVVVVSLAAFNWDDVPFKALQIYSFPTEENDAAQRTRQYAATGDAGFPKPIIESEINVSNSPISAADGEENHHGALITFEWKEHKVQKGETLSHISQNYNISYGTIVAVNNIKNARRIPAGTLLRIPTVDGLWYEVRRGDTLSKISSMQNIPLNAILDVNDIKSDNIREGEKIFLPGAKMNDIDLRLSLGDSFMYPLQGRYVTSRFGTRKDPKTGAWQFHEGVDFRGATGTTVMASLDGTVSVVGENRLYGKFIILTHGNGYKTLYAHLNSVNVKEGNNVIRGRKIGEVGETGYATGPHLHFGIYNPKGRAVNPLELLN